MNETKKQEEVGTRYFHENQPDNERQGNHMPSHGEEIQQPTLKEVLEAQANDYSNSDAVLIIGLPKSMFNFDSEGALVPLLPVDGT